LTQIETEYELLVWRLSFVTIKWQRQLCF